MPPCKAPLITRDSNGNDRLPSTSDEMMVDEGEMQNCITTGCDCVFEFHHGITGARRCMDCRRIQWHVKCEDCNAWMLQTVGEQHVIDEPGHMFAYHARLREAVE